MEESLSGGQRSSALRRPLGGSALGGSATASTPIPDFLKVMPPPRTAKPKAVSIAAPTAAAAETEALVEEREETTMGSAQSTALTTLVGQLAGIGGEAIGDLSSNPLALTSRGAAGRARLQQELAQQKGVFFTSVYQQMSRRMSPATSSNATPQELAQRGVTATRYVERYGGFGRCRDLGQLMWQLSLIMDHLQNDDMDAAKDGAALMMVCLEQSALDGGQLDVGLLLALVEDPPSSLFTNRSVTPLSRGKAFAPLAEQRWITTALSYIKELDAISARRADVAGASSKSTAAGGDPPNPKPKVKRKPKGSGRSVKEVIARDGSVSAHPQKSSSSSREVPLVPDDVPLDQSIPICRLFASFPRWILKTRSSFSWFLARTFSLRCWGVTPASVVFPLPLMGFGLFSGSGPKLSHRRWTTLARKRVLHVIIVALNFLYNDFKPFELRLLGRRPNALQARFHARLLALLATCDSPADVPIPPKRSGPEFIARLVELEQFVMASPAGTFDNYEDGFGDCSKHDGAVGWVERNKVEAPFSPSPAAPYHSLDASRLKLTGRGNWPLGSWRLPA